jgi:hypothetical protein
VYNKVSLLFSSLSPPSLQSARDYQDNIKHTQQEESSNLIGRVIMANSIHPVRRRSFRDATSAGAVVPSLLLHIVLVALLLVGCCSSLSSVSAFSSPATTTTVGTATQQRPLSPLQRQRTGRSTTTPATTPSTTTLFLFGGAPKDDGSPGDYLCKVRSFVFI